MAVDAPGSTDMLRTYRESCVLSHSLGEKKGIKSPHPGSETCGRKPCCCGAVMLLCLWTSDGSVCSGVLRLETQNVWVLHETAADPVEVLSGFCCC